MVERHRNPRTRRPTATARAHEDDAGGPPERADRAARREGRRAELLDAASRAVREHGAQVSMEDVAAAAGVTKPILYRHFGDRGGLIAALAQRYSAALLGEIEAALGRGGEPRDLLASTIDAYLAFVERDPALYTFVVQRVVTDQPEALAALGDFQRQVGTAVAVVLGEQMRSFGVDSGGAEPLAHGLVGMVHAAGDWWVDRRTMPRSRLVRYLTDLLWQGFEGMIPSEPGSP